MGKEILDSARRLISEGVHAVLAEPLQVCLRVCLYIYTYIYIYIYIYICECIRV